MRIKNIMAMMNIVVVPMYAFYVQNIFYVMVAVVFLSFKRSENKRGRFLIIVTYIIDELFRIVVFFKHAKFLFSPRKM